MDKPLALIKDLMGDFADRRREPRYPCHLPASIVTASGQSADCEILSLSSGGLSARCSSPLESGETVQVRRPGDERALPCQVQWSSKADQIARLAVVDPAGDYWLCDELEQLAARARDSRQRRGGVRVKCRIPARLSWPGVSGREAMILDLGTTGARLQSAGEPLPTTMQVEFGPLDHLEPVSAQAELIGRHDSQAMHYGIVFTGFAQGGPGLIRDYVNHVFTPKREKSP